MMANVVEENGSPAASRPEAAGPLAEAAQPAPAPADTPEPTPAGDAADSAVDDAKSRTGTAEPMAAARIVAIRERIDQIDRTLVELWEERARLSQEVGATRVATGGTRLVLSREREILERFRAALGADGAQLALLLLRAGRGPL